MWMAAVTQWPRMQYTPLRRFAPSPRSRLAVRGGQGDATSALTAEYWRPLRGGYAIGVSQLIRDTVEACRAAKGVRAFDY